MVLATAYTITSAVVYCEIIEVVFCIIISETNMQCKKFLEVSEINITLFEIARNLSFYASQ